jgi:hypothetical protein
MDEKIAALKKEADLALSKIVPEYIPAQTKRALVLLGEGKAVEGYLCAEAGVHVIVNATIGTLSRSSGLLIRATSLVAALCEAQTTDEEILALISERSRVAREEYYREMDRKS